VDAAGGHWQPQAPGAANIRDGRQRRAAPAAMLRQTAGSSTIHCHPMSDQERDRKVRQRPAPAMANRQIRSLVLYIDLDGSRRI
jgi:hypothetical protein